MARYVWIGINMAKAIRIEGVAGGSGGVGGKTKGLTRAQIKKIQKAKPLTEPKSAVKVKPAAKQQPSKKNIDTFIKKRAMRNAQINEAQKSDDFINSGIRRPGPFSDGKTKLIRQIKASNKTPVKKVVSIKNLSPTGKKYEIEIQGKKYLTGGPAEKKIEELRKLQEIKKNSKKNFN